VDKEEGQRVPTQEVGGRPRGRGPQAHALGQRLKGDQHERHHGRAQLHPPVQRETNFVRTEEGDKGQNNILESGEVLKTPLFFIKLKGPAKYYKHRTSNV